MSERAKHTLQFLSLLTIVSSSTDRAEKLLGGLGGEKTRWSESAKTLHESISNIVGDVLLAGGCTAYLGFFTTEVSRVCCRNISAGDSPFLSAPITSRGKLSNMRPRSTSFDAAVAANGRTLCPCEFSIKDFNMHEHVALIFFLFFAVLFYFSLLFCAVCT